VGEVANTPLTAHHHVAHQRRIAGKQEAVDHIGFVARSEQRRTVIENQKIGARTLAQPCDIRGCSQGAALQGPLPERRANAFFRPPCGHVAMTRNQALAIFEPAKLFHRRHGNVRVRADAQRATRIDEGGQREQSIAEIGFRRRAQPGDRAAFGQAVGLVRREVCRVDQGPARVDVRVVEQPFDRARAAYGEAVLHFANLFGDMNMDGQFAAHTAGQQGTHGVFRYRAQRMQRDAQPQHVVLHRREALEQGYVLADVVAKALLPLGQRTSVEATGHVEHRQQGQADAGFFCRLDQRQRHRGGLGVVDAPRAVVQIVELTDLRVTRFHHLDIELGGDGLEVVRVDGFGKGVHRLAPRPEAVFARTAPLRQARHRPLEGV